MCYLKESFILFLGYSLDSKIPHIIVYYLPYKQKPTGAAFGYHTREDKGNLL